jgi:UDP-N-acetylmuramyl pentapeptide phosphotransferase/UDP-N-acetylglucosamine-1-phosphate transferase
VLVLAALLAALAGGVAILLTGALVGHPPELLRRRNFRGTEVPLVGGMVLLFTMLAAESALTLVALGRPVPVDAGGAAASPSAAARAFGSADHVGLFVLVIGFFALGMIDDAAGSESSRGLRGHLSSLRRGAPSGGALKAIGGLAVSLVAAGLWELRLGPALLDAALVALAANLLNLVDLRPGRACKLFLIAWAPLGGVAALHPFLPLSVPIAAAAAVWLPFDLRERGMLGDSGANLLGAVLGAGFALDLPTPAKLAALAVLIALTLASERWSFSTVIARVPPLRWLDELGRLPEQA